MNLHNIVSGSIGSVNPFLQGFWCQSNGYLTDASGKRRPAYRTPVPVRLQVQSLTGKDLKLLDSLNIQGVQRAVYAKGNIQGANRPRQQGGDLLKFDDSEFGVGIWLVTVVLETWPTGWCKVGVTLQMPEDGGDPIGAFTIGQSAIGGEPGGAVGDLVIGEGAIG